MSNFHYPVVSSDFTFKLKPLGAVWVVASFRSPIELAEFQVAYRYATPIRDLIRATLDLFAGAAVRREFTWDGDSCRYLVTLAREERQAIRLVVRKQTDYLKSGTGELALDMAVSDSDLLSPVYLEAREFIQAVKFRRDEVERMVVDLPIEELCTLHTRVTGQPFDRIPGWSRASRLERLAIMGISPVA